MVVAYGFGRRPHDIAFSHDVQIAGGDAFNLKGLKLEGGVNNLFGVNPPICYTCTLNGYDASTYDLPGAFWYVRGTFKF